MKSLLTTSLIVAGFLFAAFVMPDLKIKVVEGSASACDSPECDNDG